MSEELHIITEVGVFGNLDINDPTAKKVKKNNDNLSESDVQALIEVSIQNNANIKV